MATYSFHRLIMGKVEIENFYCLIGDNRIRILFLHKSRGYDSVIRRMKSLVCSGIDSMCVFSSFALELEDK